jgi:WD40 repeat protein
VAWSCDGQYFATASDDGRLIVWDATGKTCYTLQRPSRFIDVKFAPANKASPSAGLCVAALNENGNIYLLHLDAPAASTQH